MSTYRFECSKCDIEILTQGHELTECLYCRVTTDNTQTLYNALAELKASQDEAKNAISILNLWYNLGWSEDYREAIEKLTNKQASETKGEG